MLCGLGTIRLWIVVFTAFALSRTLLAYGSCYIDKEDRGGLVPFVYKSVLREGEALSFAKFISVFFHSSQTYKEEIASVLLSEHSIRSVRSRSFKGDLHF